MKWIASSLLITVLAIAIFANASTVSALPGAKTPTPKPQATPVSGGVASPTPTPTP